MKIITIVGARPQFIKAAVVSRAIQKHNQGAAAGDIIVEKILHTGQHYDDNMSRVFFEEMLIPEPAFNIGVAGGTHGAMTGRMLEKIELILLDEKPDWVLVYGDTNSTLAGALAAKKLHIRLAHVEAGLRSFNMRMPEEQNRILTDRISDLLFCPTANAVRNLEKEGFAGFPCRVVVAGVVMFDAAMYYRQFARRPACHGLPDSDFILCTLHRAENTDDRERITSIITALTTLAEETAIVLPLHPRTKKLIGSHGLSLSHKNILVIEPVSYLEMVWLLEHCRQVMTDSGGLQKEAYFFKKPCITLRDETEWVELVEAGANIIAGSDADKILSSYRQQKEIAADAYARPLYGDGNSGALILQSLNKE